MRGSDLVRVCARTPEEGDGLDQGEGAHLGAKRTHSAPQCPDRSVGGRRIFPLPRRKGFGHRYIAAPAHGQVCQ